MGVILPPEVPEKAEKRIEEKKEKIIIYFRKEFELKDPETFFQIGKLIEKAYSEGLFDDMYIIKGKDIVDLIEFKESYTFAALNEIKHLKEEYKKLIETIKGLVNIIKDLKNEIERLKKE